MHEICMHESVDNPQNNEISHGAGDCGFEVLRRELRGAFLLSIIDI
jgi:hypothetical protein